MHFARAFFVLNQELYTFHFANVRNSSAWGRNYKISRSFDGGPLPPSVYVDSDVIHVIMVPGLPLPFLHTASDQKLDGGKAWEMLLLVSLAMSSACYMDSCLKPSKDLHSDGQFTKKSTAVAIHEIMKSNSCPILFPSSCTLSKIMQQLPHTAS